jgi:class 3 adenylate cyclase
MREEIPWDAPGPPIGPATRWRSGCSRYSRFASRSPCSPSRAATGFRRWACGAAERAAVEAGRAIVEAVASLAPEPGGARLSAGVGIATGEDFVGDIEAADRRIWTVIGNTTNLAARLQALTRELDAAIAVDEATHASAGAVCADFAERPETRIRGRSESLAVWALPLSGVSAAAEAGR